VPASSLLLRSLAVSAPPSPNVRYSIRLDSVAGSRSGVKPGPGIENDCVASDCGLAAVGGHDWNPDTRRDHCRAPDSQLDQGLRVAGSTP
jgi:hypothetical protein